MINSTAHPVKNRLMVYAGIAIVVAAVFPPSVIVTAPTIIGWYRGAKRLEATSRQSVINHMAQRDYDRAVRSFMA